MGLSVNFSPRMATHLTPNSSGKRTSAFRGSSAIPTSSGNYSGRATRKQSKGRACSRFCLSQSHQPSACGRAWERCQEDAANSKDKGHYRGDVDGVLGLRTRASIRGFQKPENLPVTGQLDTQTAGKLGVAPEGRSETGYGTAQGKPSAGIKWTKGSGRASKTLWKAVQKVAAPESGRANREKTLRAESDSRPRCRPEGRRTVAAGPANFSEWPDPSGCRRTRPQYRSE